MEENIKRDGLNPIEEALSYQRLIEDFNYTHEQIAVRVDKDRSTVTNILRLLKLPKETQAKIITGEITKGQAYAILSLPQEDRRVVTERITKDKLTIRQIQQLSKSYQNVSHKTFSQSPFHILLSYRLYIMINPFADINLQLAYASLTSLIE